MKNWIYLLFKDNKKLILMVSMKSLSNKNIPFVRELDIQHLQYVSWAKRNKKQKQGFQKGI
jgi:hypothetical protein